MNKVTKITEDHGKFKINIENKLEAKEHVKIADESKTLATKEAKLPSFLNKLENTPIYIEMNFVTVTRFRLFKIDDVLH